MISIQSLLGGDGKSKPVDTNAPQGKLKRDDAYSPKAVQEKILERIRNDAEADAIRHAEDMANRAFPVVEEAESVGAQRIAALGAAYAAARSQIDVEIDVGKTELSRASIQLEKTEQTLEGAGVPEGQLQLAPLGEGLVSRWQVLLALALGAGAGVLLARTDLKPLPIGVVVIFTITAIAAIFSLRFGQPESARLTALRRNRRKEATEVGGLEAKLKHDEALAEGLVEETLRLVEAEQEFAKQMVATYESAAASAMPVGSLGKEERLIQKQRVPNVRTPVWAEDLEEA
jgi:hypothetical protein